MCCIKVHPSSQAGFKIPMCKSRFLQSCKSLLVKRKNRIFIEAARTMFDEYKTSDQLWAEAINTACHAINRFYLHKIMKKTAYENLTGNKPKVHYFRVFGSKCFILNNKSKSSIFAPKVDEGFMLGCGSNAHAYRVFNKAFGWVEIAKDVTFDEFNGSQEQFDPSFVEKEELPCETIKKLALGEVKSQERKEHEEEGGTRWTCAIPAQSPEVPEKVPEVPDIPEKFAKSKLKIKYFKMLLQFLSMESMMIKMKTMKINCMRKKTNNQFKDNDSYHTQECTKAFNATIRRGVTTRSCLANFCESYSFVSSLEPLRVNQALEDLNGSWMIRSLW